MTDIVEQLENTTGIHEELIYEAAKEIKRLRTKMQEIYDLHHNDSYDIFLRDDVTYEIVCEALEMKDD